MRDTGSSIAISVEGLSKSYEIRGARPGYGMLREALYDLARGSMRSMRGALTGRGARRAPKDIVWALRDVSFEVRRGQALGLIGRNGSGKSTLLKVLSGITTPTAGRGEIRGRLGSLLEVGSGFHMELTGRENVFLNGAILGMKRFEIARKFDEIIEFAEVQRFIDTPVKHYSSGMHLRLAFAVAAHLETEILLVDEVLAVGDAAFQAKCVGKMDKVAHEGRTVLFVSHNLQAVQSLCDTAIWLDEGAVREAGDSAEVITHYLSSIHERRSEMVWDDEDAPGNKRVRLRGLKVSDANGDSSGVFSSNSDLLIEIRFFSAAEETSVGIGFELLTAYDEVVLSSFQDDLPVGQRPVIAAGENSWRCRIPSALLNRGTYKVGPRMDDRRSGRMIDPDPVVQFDVLVDHGVSPTWSAFVRKSDHPGVIAPILDWEATS